MKGRCKAFLDQFQSYEITAYHITKWRLLMMLLFLAAQKLLYPYCFSERATVLRVFSFPLYREGNWQYYRQVPEQVKNAGKQSQNLVHSRSKPLSGHVTNCSRLTPAKLGLYTATRSGGQGSPDRPSLSQNLAWVHKILSKSKAPISTFWSGEFRRALRSKKYVFTQWKRLLLYGILWHWK